MVSGSELSVSRSDAMVASRSAGRRPRDHDISAAGRQAKIANANALCSPAWNGSAIKFGKKSRFPDRGGVRRRQMADNARAEQLVHGVVSEERREEHGNRRQVGGVRRSGRGYAVGSFRCDHTVPKVPKGTETRKTSRQFTGARSPPTTRPMNWPLMPTTLSRPRASPR
jgi:hypothetical protein